MWISKYIRNHFTVTMELEFFSVRRGGAQLEPPPSPSLSLVSVWLVYSPVSTSYERQICWQQGRPVNKLSFSSSPSPSIIPLEVMSKRLLLSGINRCSPRKTKSAIDNCKEYTAATVSIGVSSTPLVLRDKETHSLEQYNFFWPICLLQTYDE